MAKILLINNQTKLLDELRNLFQGEVTIKEWSKVLPSDVSGYDLIVLSGASHLFPVINNEDRLRSEIEIIQNSSVPVVGICYGSQVIADIFGATIQKIENPMEQIVTIDVLTPEDIFESRTEFTVFEAHHYAIQNVSQELIPLAQSAHGIELFRHATRPIYGIQFHPEHIVEGNEGGIIFKNILNKLGIS